MLLNKLKLICLALGIAAGAFLFYSYFPRFDFYWAGSIRDFRAWFPTFYIAAFAATKMLFPILLGAVLYTILSICFELTTEIKIFLAFIETLLILAVELSGDLHFIFICILTLAFLSIFICLYGIFENILKQSSRSFSLMKLISGSVFFALYIIICLSAERAHPFAKYAMFSYFSDSTATYFLRGDSNLIALNEYCKLNGNELNEIQWAEKRSTIHRDESEMWKEIMMVALTNMKKPLPYDSISLNRFVFYIDSGKMKSNEEQLYKCKNTRILR